MGSHHWFHDEEERRRWQDPETLLRDVGLSRGFTFIDVGCGDGFFALPAAKFVGEERAVYALDRNYDAVDRLNLKPVLQGLRNLRSKVGEAEETVLCEGCADIVFFGIVLHDFEDPVKVLTNAKSMLKTTGRLVDLDWKKKPMELGPPVGIRFSEEEAVRLVESVGFRIETVKETGAFHYVHYHYRKAMIPCSTQCCEFSSIAEPCFLLPSASLSTEDYTAMRLTIPSRARLSSVRFLMSLSLNRPDSTS